MIGTRSEVEEALHVDKCDLHFKTFEIFLLFTKHVCMHVCMQGYLFLDEGGSEECASCAKRLRE